MKALKPLTISNSISDNPTVLLTSDFEKYVFVQTLEKEFMLAHTIYKTLHRHFKIELLQSGTFQLKGSKYFCTKKIEGSEEVQDWIGYMWSTKHSFNNLLNTGALFRMFLIDLYFPVFNPSKKIVVPGRKDRFVVEAYPELRDGGTIKFQQSNINKAGLTSVAFRNLFQYLGENIHTITENFEVLNHENLYMDLKYQVSLYPEIRNKFWDELKQCFEPSFLTYVKTDIQNYLLKL